MRNIRGLAVVSLMMLATNAQASGVAFDQLSDDEANKIIKEFSGNFTHTSVSGAGPLGTIFGFDVGVVGGMTATDEIDKQATAAGADASSIPHGGILGMVSFPLGLTAEAVFIPKVGGDDFKFNSMGLAGKWTLTSTILSLPFDLGVRAHFTSTKLEFQQTVSSVTSNVEFDNKTMGAQLLVSKSFIVLEPYAGIGYVTGDGDFSISGTTTFFSSGVTTYSNKESSFQFLAGLEAKLLFLKLGAEYSNQLGVSRYTGKLAFSF